MNKKVAIVIPAFNEELSIENTIREFHQYCPEALIYVVNNNSTDRTAAVAQYTLEDLDCGKVIYEPLQGKGSAIRSALSQVDCDLLVLVDADGSHRPEQLHSMMEMTEERQLDLLIGNRFRTGEYQGLNKRPLHNIGNRAISSLVRALFGAKIGDVLCGYRVLSRRFYKDYPAHFNGFEVEIDMTVYGLANGFRVDEHPVGFSARPMGSHSKVRTFKDGFKLLIAILKIHWNLYPLRTAALVGLPLAFTTFLTWKLSVGV